MVVAWERLILTSLLVATAVHFVHHANLLERFESRWLDLMAYSDRPSFSAPVTVVAITDGDYESSGLFQGISPLDPAVLERLVQQISAHGARGGILDVQIHPPSYESETRSAARARLYETLDSLARQPGTQWVLVRDFGAELRSSPAPGVARSRWERLTGDRRVHWADPGLERREGKVRDLPFTFEARDGLPPRASVLGAAIDAFRLEPMAGAAHGKGSHEDWRVRFSGEFLDDTSAIAPHRITAGALLAARPRSDQKSMLAGQVVLLGGTYHDGCDLHPTPLDEMAGVYVWAEGLASWFRQDALREPPAIVTLLLEALVGIVAGLLLLRFGPGWGLLYSLMTVLPLAVLFSLLTFGERVLFINFLPSFLGVYLHYQVELHLEIARMRRELAAATAAQASD